MGIEALDLHVVYDTDDIGGAGREQQAERLTKRLAGLSQERVRPYRRSVDGDYGQESRALHKGVHPGRTDLAVPFRD